MLGELGKTRTRERNTRVKGVVRDAILCGQDRPFVDFFPQSEISRVREFLRRVDRKFVPFSKQIGENESTIHYLFFLSFFS